MTAFNGDARPSSEEISRDTLERLPLALLLVDDDGRIRFANVRTERLFGYARHELIDTRADAIVPGACARPDGDSKPRRSSPAARIRHAFRSMSR